MSRRPRITAGFFTLALCLAWAPPALSQDASLGWDPNWPKFRPAEYVLTGLAGSASLVLYFGMHDARSPRLTGGVLFDDYFRDTLRLRPPGQRDVARTDIDVHPTLRKRMVGQLPEERAFIESILSRGLVDVGRKVEPDNDRLFTWWAPWRNLRQRNIGWRLDYVVASDALVGEDVTCAAYREVGTSDHGPVIAWLRDRPA